MSQDSRVMTADEYQYPEEEYGPETAAETIRADGTTAENFDASTYETKKSTPLNHITNVIQNNRRTVGVIAISIIIMLGFKIFAIFKNEGPLPAKASQPSVAAQPVSTVTPQSTITSEQLNSLRFKEQSAGAVTALQSEVRTLRGSLEQMSQLQLQLAQSVGFLTSQVKQLSSQVQDKKPKAKIRHPYHIKAIISGRAWIENSEGVAQSVAVGDKIPEYGEVLSLNADQGTLATSSGRSIRLGSNDR